MAAPVAARRMTTQELLDMPDDGVRRWLINGELREMETTRRNRFHSSIMAEVTASLVIWNRSQPSPRGTVVCGEAGVRLRKEPDTTVGIDVAYVPNDVMVRQTDEITIIEGAPSLAVEILSPSSKQEEVDEKIDSYLEHGVAVIWLIDPHDRTVIVYRPNQPPKLYTERDEIGGFSELPGFAAPVAEFFPSA